jgi:hypothetical protein
MGWVVALEWHTAVDWSFEDGEADTDVLWWSEGGSGINEQASDDSTRRSYVLSVLDEEETVVDL